MEEYISKKAAEDIFARARRAMKPERYTGQEFFIRDNILLNAQQIIHSIQSADVRPVVHGKWIEKQDKDGKTYGVCSCCGYEQYAGHLKYCPECGSENDGTNQ